MSTILNLSGAIKLGPLAAAPTPAVEGTFYYNTTDKVSYYYDGTDWIEIADAAFVDSLASDLAALQDLSGVAGGETDLGSFTGTTIPDDSTIKGALQSLETALESATSSLVTAVNGQTGNVVLDSDNIPEGDDNLYFTDARAKTAAVVDSTAGSETDQAASVAAMKTYVASSTPDLSAYLKHDGSVAMTGNLDLDSHKIVNLLDPSAAQDAATKNYVDSAISSAAGANQSLSNLTTTSINQDLLPSATNTRDLGSSSLRWKDLWLENALLSTITDPSAGEVAIDAINRTLKTGSVTKLNWSGTNVSLNTRKLTDVVDPTANQDAATKKYVDDSIAALPDPITYQGTWDASTNTPTLDDSDTNVGGFLYRVTAAGVVDFGSGNISFAVGDSVVNNGTVWEKWDHSDQVDSVNGQTGAVVLDLNDLNDVNAASPADGQVLIWDDINGEWIPGTPAAGYTDEQAQDAVGGILDNGTIGDIAFTYNDTTPVISATIDNDAVTSAKIAESPIVRTSLLRGADLTEANTVVESYVNSISIAASASASAIASLATTMATFDGIEITYRLKDSANAVRIGTLRIAASGTDISIVDSFAESAITNISFTATIDSGTINVRYTSGAQTATMRADVKRFRA